MPALLDLTLYALPAGPLQRRLFTSGRSFTTRPTDAPANTVVASRLAGQLLARRDLVDRATTFGAIRPGRGQLTLINVDGALDSLALDYAPREVRLWWSAEHDAPFPAGWQQIAVWQLERIVLAERELQLQLADGLTVLDQPALPAVYAGTNALPDGVEGTADDIKGQRKPRVLGSVLNIAPVLVNSARLIYQLSDQPCSVAAVYDGGLPLTAGAAYASLADLQATAPAAGQYRVYSGAEGAFIRLGAAAAKAVTADANGSETRAGRLAASLATAAGLTLADIAALDSVTAPVGLYLTGDVTALAAIGELLGSIGATASLDALGRLRLARLTAPAVPLADIQPWQIKQLQLLGTDDADGGLPVWRVKIGYARNVTPQQRDALAGSVTPARAAWLAEPQRYVEAVDSAVKAAWLQPPEQQADTCLLTRADAEAEAARRLALYSGRRLVQITVPMTPALAALDVGQTVRLFWPRYGLAGGKVLLLIGIVHDFSKNEAVFRLWG